MNIFSRFFRFLNHNPLSVAFFRLYGSYEALDGGTIREAITDMTGGVPLRAAVPSRDPGMMFFRDMLRALQHQAVMGCAILVKYTFIMFFMRFCTLKAFRLLNLLCKLFWTTQPT